MHILVSNDDGIDAPGIFALVQELKKVATVTVVAPDRQQSAVGHAITMNNPLRAIPFQKDGEFFGYAVDGTPADAVKLGVQVSRDGKPDLLVSGINHGRTRRSTSSTRGRSRRRRRGRSWGSRPSRCR